MKKLFIFWLALILTPLVIWAASTGWENPTSASNYTNSTNCYTSNNSYATYNWSGSASTYLEAGGFSFTFTNFSSVDGIVVSIEHYYTSTTGITCSYEVYQFTDAEWLSKTLDPKYLPTAEQYISAGTVDDDWTPTTAWTQEDLAKLTVRVSTIRSALGLCTHYVDHIRVDITYTQTTGGQLTVSGISDWVKINGITTANISKINGITNE